MTVQDEARDVLRRKSAAEDELRAVRREIAQAVAARDGHIDKAAADVFARRLKDAQEKVREATKALAALNAEDACP